MQSSMEFKVKGESLVEEWAGEGCPLVGSPASWELLLPWRLI